MFTERKPAMLVLDSFRGHLTKEVNASEWLHLPVAAVKCLHQQVDKEPCKTTVAKDMLQISKQTLPQSP